jgi:aryl-alcohol dehydrogenase-like predicted oxidoreductase
VDRPGRLKVRYAGVAHSERRSRPVKAGGEMEILGRAVADFARRDQMVLATRVNGPMGAGTNDRGLSRKHIMQAVDASLRRLRTDYIDLYQIHRWDYETPIEETLETLDDLVRSGKVLYLGASRKFAWEFSLALHLRERHARILGAISTDAGSVG